MASWFVRGLRQGVVTTRYPHAGWAERDRWAASLPSPPAFRADLLTDELADELVERCPSRALARDGPTLRVDVGACTGCGQCLGDDRGVTRPSGIFELAQRERARLVCTVPIAGEKAMAGGGESIAAHPEQVAAAELRRRALGLFGRSLHVRTVDTGSCAACESEVRLLEAPHYDLNRLGLFFTPAPRHADLLLVTGPAVRAADTLLLAAYEATPDPKAVVAVGGCALGAFYDEDEVVHGAVDEVVPVDVYVPGCPPSPLALLHALLVAVGRLEERVLDLLVEPEDE